MQNKVNTWTPYYRPPDSVLSLFTYLEHGQHIVELHDHIIKGAYCTYNNIKISKFVFMVNSKN